jgi:Pyruvate-formate lyase-activating enzyme
MNELLFNIAAINICTDSEGPGKRFAIWFQGCDIGCSGCCNPSFQTIEKKHIMTHTQLVSVISKSIMENGIEGVTYLGGEPTLQKNLSFLSEAIQNLGLGVIMFTGKKISDISPEFLKGIDMVIDGKFDLSLPDERNLIGSSNQNLFLLTNRYRSDIEWFFEKRPKKVEVNVFDENVVFSGDVF